MALGKHHHGHHGGGGRGFRGGYSAPWWYGPYPYDTTAYTIEEESTCPLHGNRCDESCPERVVTRRRVPMSITGLPASGGYGVLGDDGGYGVLSRRHRPHGSLSRRYPQQGFGTLSDAPADGQRTAKLALGALLLGAIGLAALA